MGFVEIDEHEDDWETTPEEQEEDDED